LEAVVEIEDPSRRDALYGPADRNLRLIRAAFDVRISARNGELRISGPDEAVGRAARCLDELQQSLRTHPVITDEILRDTVQRSKAGGVLGDSAFGVQLDAAKIVPKTEGQVAYIRAIEDNDLTICLGPAGTGKTYLAVAMALSLLKRNRIKRIVLVRPAVEAGEKLGYLPGDMQAKVNPYLRPLFDAMNDMMSFDHIRRFMQNDVVEVIPLAFMRGRTLNHAVIILDEAQNATQGQMLMFLTRLGQSSKMIVTGDDSQSDLPEAEKSGLVDAINRLKDVPGVGVVRLERSDIVRHPLVQKVVAAYGDRAKGV
jgi:phosphate starvation-inducible PhoH-like protein